MLPEAYRDAELTVERPSFGNGTQAAEAGNSVSPAACSSSPCQMLSLKLRMA